MFGVLWIQDYKTVSNKLKLISLFVHNKKKHQKRCQVCDNNLEYNDKHFSVAKLLVLSLQMLFTAFSSCLRLYQNLNAAPLIGDALIRLDL